MSLLNLFLRSLAGLLFLVGMLALALFWSAGTFNYRQAWLYLAVFAACIVLITGYLIAYDRTLLQSRLNVGPAAETQRSQQVIQGLASLFFLGLYIVPGLDHRFGWSHIAPLLSVFSDGMVVLSLFLVFMVFRENTYTSAIIEVARGQKVINTGLYRIVRHPMYSGAMLLLLFTPLALGSWIGVPFALPVILVIVARLLNEEKFLQANLPGYGDYQRQVPHRLIPFIW